MGFAFLTNCWNKLLRRNSDVNLFSRKRKAKVPPKWVRYIWWVFFVFIFLFSLCTFMLLQKLMPDRYKLLVILVTGLCMIMSVLGCVWNTRLPEMHEE